MLELRRDKEDAEHAASTANGKVASLLETRQQELNDVTAIKQALVQHQKQQSIIKVALFPRIVTPLMCVHEYTHEVAVCVTQRGCRWHILNFV